MADLKKRLPANVPGEFYVDSTCIDCDACRQLASSVFAEEDGYSAVTHQPTTAVETRAAQRALLACPTGSIGTLTKNSIADVVSDYPLLLENNVYYCGFNSPKSFGGNSYFVQHPDGNWLIDSPRFTQPLLSALEKLGGLRYIFLTHRDDVADAAK
ncbi:MAG: 4Fe-4S domain-containing protein, partial [Acidobacteriota bacterium]